MAPGTQPLNCSDYERIAEERLDPGAYGYFAGGAGDERTLRDNIDAFGRWQLRPRTLVDVSRCGCETTVLGTPVSMPVLVAPTAFQRMAHPDGEAATARAAAAAGTIMCLSTLATAAPADMEAAAPGAPRWFQLYWFRDEGVTRSLVDQAVEAGFGAIVLTVDAPGAAGRRERDLRTGFAVPEELGVPSFAAAPGHPATATPAEVFSWVDPTITWGHLEQLAGMSDLPLLVKGVLTDDDARLAVENGADGVIVSNHGGRQLDGVAATLDALPEVVEAVDGRAEVLMDGGVRRGTDALKALALGARAVLVGRPVIWGLAAGGEEGVRHVLSLFHDEVALGLRLLGCPAPSDVNRAHVARAR